MCMVRVVGVGCVRCVVVHVLGVWCVVWVGGGCVRCVGVWVCREGCVLGV